MNSVPNSGSRDQSTIQDQQPELNATNESVLNKGYSEGVTGRRAVSALRFLAWLLFAGFALFAIATALPGIASFIPGIIPDGLRVPTLPWGLALLQLLWAIGWAILGGVLCSAFLVLAAIGEHVIALRARLVP